MRAPSTLGRAERRAVYHAYWVGRSHGTAHRGEWTYAPHDFDGSFAAWAPGYATRREAEEAAWAELADGYDPQEGR